MVLDSQGLAELASDTPTRAVLVALEAAAATAGRAILPTTVMVEHRFDPSDPRAANANRRLRSAVRNDLTPSRATEAARLLATAGDGPSVVDAHVAAAALAPLRGRAGASVVATSDPGDLTALLAAEADPEVRGRASVEAL